MANVPLGDILRALVPTRCCWVRWLLERARGLTITSGGTTIQLNERPGATPPRTGLDQPAKPGPVGQFGGRRR